jgi:TolB-like protein
MINRCAVSLYKRITGTSSGICPSLFQRACHSQRVCHFQGVCKPAKLLGLVILALISACSPRYHDMPAYWPVPTKEYDNFGPGRFKTALLANQIDRHYRGSAPGPIGVTTFVNIDDLYASSTFGRMVGEQLMSELAMKGFDVVELRHTDALQFLDTAGEFALSRDTRTVRPHRNLAAVVVGTYVVSPDRVYVNARLVEPSTSLILSAGSVEMSKTRELAKLLRGGSVPSSLERIPVKHLGYAGESSPLDAMRRQWLMEEGGQGLMQAPLQAAPLAPQVPSLPESPAPAALSASKDDSKGLKSTTPQLLDEQGSAPADRSAKPAIGLGR